MASRETGNGEQQGFTTGATRSTSEGKIDFEGHINPHVEHIFGDYMNRHRVQRDGRLRSSDNWQLGIPIPNYMKSFVRHSNELRQAYRGYTVSNPDADGTAFTLRDLLCALRFNLDGLILELDKTGRLDHFVIDPLERQAWEQAAKEEK